MTLRLAVGCIAAMGMLAAQTASSQPPPGPAQVADASAERALLNQYCVTCHNQKLKTADLELDKLDTAHVADHAEKWELVVRKLRSGMMPPSGMPRPNWTTYESMVAWLEGELESVFERWVRAGGCGGGTFELSGVASDDRWVAYRDFDVAGNRADAVAYSGGDASGGGAIQPDLGPASRGNRVSVVFDGDGGDRVCDETWGCRIKIGGRRAVSAPFPALRPYQLPALRSLI